MGKVLTENINADAIRYWCKQHGIAPANLSNKAGFSMNYLSHAFKVGFVSAAGLRKLENYCCVPAGTFSADADAAPELTPDLDAVLGAGTSANIAEQLRELTPAFKADAAGGKEEQDAHNVGQLIKKLDAIIDRLDLLNVNVLYMAQNMKGGATWNG